MTDVARSASPRRRSLHGGDLARVLSGLLGAETVAPSCSRCTRSTRRSSATSRSSSRSRPSWRAPRAARSGARRAALLDWQVESQSSRQLAALDEREIEWEGTAVVQRADGRVRSQFQAVAIELANSATRGSDTRSKTRAPSSSTAELAPLRRERFQRERDITERLGLAPTTTRRSSCSSGVSLVGPRAECEQFLARHAGACGTRCCPSSRKRVLGMAPTELTRADAAALFRARSSTRTFPATRMEESIRRQVREMGIDPLAGGRIVLDTGEREGKRSRAFCSPRPRAGRGVSRHATARRPDRLDDLPPRAGARAALRVHASRPARSSIAGSATTRSPKATRCCSTTACRTAGGWRATRS